MTNIELIPGSHVLWIYSNDEGYRSTLANLIKDGLDRKEKILIVGYKDDIDRFKDTFKDIEQKDEFYIFTVESISSSIDDISRLIKEEGSIFRVINLANVLSETLDSKILLEFSLKVESICKDNHTWICAIDKERIKVKDLLYIIQLHQFVIIGDRIFRDYLCLSQEELVRDNIDYALNIIRRNLIERDEL